MKINPVFGIDGQPVMGTYGKTDLPSLVQIRDAGMNLVFGGEELLDQTTPPGMFCLDNGIKVMYGVAGHVHGRPRLASAIDATQTEVPIADGIALPGPAVVQIDAELIRYREATPTGLIGCERGFEGTGASAHQMSVMLFWPEPLREEIARVKDSPNLFGYYAIDDSPGNARSALEAMYAIIKETDDANHPVCGGYSGATTLHNFSSRTCDVVMMYFYPFLRTGYKRTMASFDTQWMLTDLRRRAPGIPFFGIYQGFWGGQWNQQHPLTPREIREQVEDFVRDGASGIISFYVSDPPEKVEFVGWNNEGPLREEIRAIHEEIRRTGGLSLPPEPEEMASARLQPQGYYVHPNEVPGMVPAWHLIGPFDCAAGDSLDAVFPPEHEIDLQASYAGKEATVRWEKRPAYAGTVGLVELYGGVEYVESSTAYAMCTVTGERQERVQLRCGSDDDLLVWIGGEEVWRHEGARGVHLDADIVPVTLPAGETTILVKIYNRDGQWGFFMRFTDLSGRPLEGLRFLPAVEASQG